MFIKFNLQSLVIKTFAKIYFLNSVIEILILRNESKVN